MTFFSGDRVQEFQNDPITGQRNTRQSVWREDFYGFVLANYCLKHYICLAPKPDTFSLRESQQNVLFYRQTAYKFVVWIAKPKKRGGGGGREETRFELFSAAILLLRFLSVFLPTCCYVL